MITMTDEMGTLEHRQFQEKQDMAFVNEYVSDEDVKKYKLDDIWLKYHPECVNMPSVFKHHWTRDQERDAYFMKIATGREELSSRITFNLYWNGQLFEAKLDLAPGGSQSYKERPYKIIWELVGIWPSQSMMATREEVLAVLKEALSARGDDGARSYVMDTTVEFKNF